MVKSNNKSAQRTGAEIDRLVQRAEPDFQNNTPSALKKLYRAKELSEKNNFYRLDDIEFWIGYCLRNLGDFALAVSHFEKSVQLRKNSDNVKQYARSLSAAGKCYYYAADSDKSLDYLLQALKIQEKAKDYTEQCRTLIFIANIHEAFTRDYKRAGKLYSEALRLSRKVKHRNLEASSLGGISSALTGEGNFNGAIGYLHKAEKIYLELNDKYLITQVYEDLGSIHFKQKKFSEAAGWFSKMLETGRDIKNDAINAVALINLALCYYELGDDGKFLEYSESGAKILDRVQDKLMLFTYYRQFAEIYYAKGELEKAYRFQEKYNSEYVKFRDKEIADKTNVLMASFEIERAEKEAEILKMKNNELRKEVETKSKELNISANYILRKNEFINEIFDEINSYVKKTDIGRIHRENILSFLKMVEARKRLNQEMVSFEKNLNSLNVDLVKRLSKKFPTLSPVELKICSMLKISLTTKDISKLLFISPRTVETHRHHIIKKLKLPKSRHLTAFINTL